MTGLTSRRKIDHHEICVGGDVAVTERVEFSADALFDFVFSLRPRVTCSVSFRLASAATSAMMLTLSNDLVRSAGD